MSASRPPLSARQTFLPDDIARQEFNTAFRGYEPTEVRAFLSELSEQAAELADARAELEIALADAQTRKGDVELDEETVTRMLGEQTAQILRSAREAAADTRQRAEDEVSNSLREAHEASARMRSEAEAILTERTAEAEEISTRLRTEANDEVEAIRAQLEEEERTRRAQLDEDISQRDEQHRKQVEMELEDAREEGRNIIEAAREEAEGLVERTRKEQSEKLEAVLRKRSIALAQVEELRAGRQRLLDAYKMVRETLDDISGELERVDEEARNAASQAGARSAESAGLKSSDLDEPIVLDEHFLNDDVSESVIDLVASRANKNQREAVGASTGSLRNSGNQAGNIGNDQDDNDDWQNNNGGGAGFFDHASTLDAVDEENLWSPVEDRLEQGVDLDGTRDPSQPVVSIDAAARGREQYNTSVIEHQEVQVADISEHRDNQGRSSMRTSTQIGQADRGNSAQADRLMLMRREATTTKNRPQVIRKLKAALNEEQIAIATQLENGQVQSIDELLGSLEDQASHYSHAVVKLFREIVRSGASSVQGSRGIELGGVERAGNEAARSMALALVEDLREQLVPVLDSEISGAGQLSTNDIGSRIAEPYASIGGPYLDVLVVDRVGEAFDQGVELIL